VHMDADLLLSDTNIIVNNLDTNQQLTVQSSSYIQSERYRIFLANNLVANGNYSLLFKFRAQTRDQGLYYHGYTDGAGQRSLLATRFFPIEARTVL
jgi:hypothetical protein